MTTIRRTITSDAYDNIRSRLLLGELRPNQRLIETDLARALNISRTPIREALQRLEAEGLVSRSRRGWAVYEHNSEEIKEIYQIRAALDSYAARLVALRLTEGDKKVLMETAELAIKYEGLSPHQLVTSNNMFHGLIMQLSGNRSLIELSNRTRHYYFNINLAASYSAEDTRTGRQQHEAISEAIIEGDAELASRLAREHAETALRVGLPMLNRGTSWNAPA